MMSWFHKLFAPKVRIPRSIEVGKAIISIDNEETTYVLTLEGFCADVYDDEDWVYSARDRFTEWQYVVGKTGMVPIGGGNYVPLCNVKNIAVEYLQHQIEAK